MREAPVSRHLLASLLALAIPLGHLNLALAQTPPAAPAPAPAANRILEGRILDEEGKAIEKAVVKVRNLETGEEFTSPPTGSNGSYKFNKLPPGRYEIAVQTQRGVYLGNRTVDLVNREAQTYSFSLRNVPAEQALEQARAARGATEEDRDRPAGGRPPVTPSEQAARQAGFWRNPVSATLAGLAIAIGAAVIVDEARDEDDDDDASPSGP